MTIVFSAAAALSFYESTNNSMCSNRKENNRGARTDGADIMMPLVRLQRQPVAFSGGSIVLCCHGNNAL
jgi:hypothetical protein